MENPRTTSARDHDDHEMIDAAVAGSEPDAQGSTAGGHLAVDMATQSEHDQVGDPEGSLRVEKTDKINNNVERSGNRGGGDHQL